MRTYFDYLSPHCSSWNIFAFTRGGSFGHSASREGCLRIKDVYPCVRAYIHAHRHACQRVAPCISRMPIGTRGKFADTHGAKRGSRLRGVRRGVQKRCCAPMIYGNVTSRHIERRPGWHCQGAHTAFCRLRIRSAAPLSVLPSRLRVHIILTGNPGCPALISSTLGLALRMTSETRALRNPVYLETIVPLSSLECFKIKGKFLMHRYRCDKNSTAFKISPRVCVTVYASTSRT